MIEKKSPGHEAEREEGAVRSLGSRRLAWKMIVLSIASAVILLIAGGVLGYFVAPRGKAPLP